MILETAVTQAVEDKSSTANSGTTVAVLPESEQVRQLPVAFRTIYIERGRRVIGIFRSLIQSKTSMELIFNHWVNSVKFGGPSQPNPLSSPPLSCPCDLFRSFKFCSDAKERVLCEKQREATAPIQSLVKLQPWFLSLQWTTCLWQNFNLSSCACSEGLSLGQNTLLVIYFITVWQYILQQIKYCKRKPVILGTKVILSKIIIL